MFFIVLFSAYLFAVRILGCSDYLFKLLLIGDSSVGKSCLLLRFAVIFLFLLVLFFFHSSSFGSSDCNSSFVAAFVCRMIRMWTATLVPLELILCVYIYIFIYRASLGRTFLIHLSTITLCGVSFLICFFSFCFFFFVFSEN